MLDKINWQVTITVIKYEHTRFNWHNRHNKISLSDKNGAASMSSILSKQRLCKEM